MAQVDFTFHPLAEIFPLMDGAELDALAADIKEHGQHSAIVLHEDQILDGRNRYRACIEAGVDPRFETFAGTNPIAFVVSHNIHRRHLNTSQRAMIAAQIATLKHGHVGSQSSHHSDEGEKSPSSFSTEAAAALLNVDRATVTYAKKVLREGTAEEIKAVMDGHARVSNIARKIHKKLLPEERMKKNPDANVARHATQRANGKMWRTFKDALINLTSLPLPSDVARIVRAQDRQSLTDQKLLVALNWLQEFSNEWTSPEFDAKGNSRRKNKPAGKTGEVAAAQEAETGSCGDDPRRETPGRSGQSTDQWRKDYVDAREGDGAA